MEIYLIDPASNVQLQLPVNPIGDIQLTREKQIETVNIIDIGDVDFSTGDRVTQISFSSLLPKEYDPGYCKYPNIPDPQDAMHQLNVWTKQHTPIRLMITGTIHNVLVLLSAHNSTYRGGEVDGLYYDLTLRLWREVKVRTTADLSNSGGGAGASRPDLKPVGKIYTVKPGDSLWKIAQMELGNGGRMKDIYAIPENRKVIGPDMNLIKAGQQLVMPA